MFVLDLTLALVATDTLISTQQARLVQRDGVPPIDDFAAAVALDGDTLIVGASQDDHSGLTDAGSAYVFVRSGAIWAQQGKLTASDAQDGDRFGYSVAIQGDIVVVGALADDHSSLTNPGAAYVFQRTGSSWTQALMLIASDPASDDAFGWSVAIDGGTIAVTSASDPMMFGPSGAVYVFAGAGLSWPQQTKLTGSTYRMHFSVALSGDTIVVGAPYEGFVNPGSNYGAAEVFVRSGTTWSHEALLAAPMPFHSAEFGHSATVLGSTLAIGAWGENFSGAVYVFDRNGAAWSQSARLLPTDSTIGPFGQSVALTNQHLAIGAGSSVVSGVNAAGAVILFERGGTTWTSQHKLVAADPTNADLLGTSVALDGQTLIAGAPEPSTGPGAAYVFTFQAPTRFCFGDGSLASPCPCAAPDVVPSPSGAPGAGCANSLNIDGATLTARGSLFPESLEFAATIAASYVGFGFLVRGTAQNAAGMANGDGVRCVSGAFIRFGGHNSGTNGDAVGSWAYPNDVQTTLVTVASAQQPGSTSHYQLVYRNPAAGFCSPGTTNWTNAVSLSWP